MDGGDTITIGDACDDTGDAATIDQARALLARASAILESIDQGDA